MELVLANKNDLANVQEMFTNIIKNMYAQNIKIWDEYYPNEVFMSDIDNKNLYLLKEGDEILGAFSLYEHIDIEQDVEWQDKNAKAYLLNRVGVNVNYLQKGIGQKLVKMAKDIAKEKKGEYLRLLVCEVNTPAINLYKKCKLKKVKGIHEEKIEKDYSLNEYGFEVLLT